MLSNPVLPGSIETHGNRRQATLQEGTDAYLRKICVLVTARTCEFTLRKIPILSEILRLGSSPANAETKKVAYRCCMTRMEVEALASMLTASVVDTALLKEVRASASVGGGGRRR
jgi:hypothetical protein